VSGGPGPVRVRLDYARFARNYGGAWASRLKLVEMPACALTTPGARGCRTMTPVTGSNDGTRSVWADVQLGAAAQGVVPTAMGRTGSLFSARAVPGLSRSMVLAAVATPAGAAGSYAATSLNSEAPGQ
jgi:hypothetical protein